MTRIILDDTMWEHMCIVVCALFPALIVLHVADSNKPGMDKLFLCMMIGQVFRKIKRDFRNV